jgi:uncharacterized protein YlxW (UPF0749 family)
MLKLLLNKYVELVFFLIVFTQVLIPLLVPNLKFFWLFRKDSEPKKTNQTLSDLSDEVDETAEKSAEVKGKVDDVVAKVDEIKSKTNKI